MSLTALLALATLLIAAPLNWYVVWKLWGLYRATPHIPVLRDRVIVAVAVAVIVTVFALIFVNNDLAEPVLTADVTRLLTRTVVLVGGVIPAAYWLWLYR